MVIAMTYVADPRVDAYIDGLPEWQRLICREVQVNDVIGYAFRGDHSKIVSPGRRPGSPERLRK